MRGSRASVQEQHRTAQAHGFTFLETPADVRRYANAGLLVQINGNGDYEIASVSFPYARPEVRTFLERLGRQYRSVCGEPLIVTSLTRPRNRQPTNASSLSVHPTGMAVDLRVSHNPACRNWLESTLLQLDRRGVINATRENRPPHYHVAVYPTQYRQYVENLTRRGGETVVARADVTYRVGRGDTLWGIARSHNTTVDRIKQENGLSSSRIYAGQLLRIPSSR